MNEDVQVKLAFFQLLHSFQRAAASSSSSKKHECLKAILHYAISQIKSISNGPYTLFHCLCQEIMDESSSSSLLALLDSLITTSFSKDGSSSVYLERLRNELPNICEFILQKKSKYVPMLTKVCISTVFNSVYCLDVGIME